MGRKYTWEGHSNANEEPRVSNSEDRSGEHQAQDRQRFENQLETGNNHDSPFPSFGRMLSLDAASLLLEGRRAEKLGISKN